MCFYVFLARTWAKIFVAYDLLVCCDYGCDFDFDFGSGSGSDSHLGLDCTSWSGCGCDCDCDCDYCWRFCFCGPVLRWDFGLVADCLVELGA